MNTQKIITLAFIVFVTIMTNSCEDLGFGCIRGNGDLTTENRVISDFEGVEVEGSFIVYIDSSNETSILVEADENLLDEIRTQVRGNNLIIETYRDRCLNSRNDITIYVTAPDIEEIKLLGSGRIYCDEFESSEMNVELTGSGSIFFDYINSNESDIDLIGSGTIRGTIDTYSANILIEGSGIVRLEGSAHHANMDLLGSGSIQAREFTTDIADVDLTGSGKVEVFATEFLEASVTGSGMIYYYGNPAEVIKHISGSGNIVER
jgi:hypothetical protein